MTLIAATSLLVLGSGRAHADSDGPFIACGYADTPGAPAAVSIGNGCTDLDTALSDALTFSNEFASPSQVQLMPGLYCPVTLPQFSREITLIGVGASGIDTSGGPSTYAGPEAGLTSFAYNSGSCGASPPSYDFATPDHGTFGFGGITLENLTVDGSTGGVANGIDVVNAGLRLYDDQIQNFTGTGLTFYYSFPQGYGGLDAEHSAILDNQVGVSITTGVNVGVDASTIAGNGTGLAINGPADLLDDTVSHNGTGISVNNDQGGQLANSIVGDNTTADCGGNPGQLESNGGGNNLLASGCDPNTSDSQPDILLTDSIDTVADNGGPTPSILPPSQAVDHGVLGICGGSLSKVDQREYLENGPDCDIGSVNTTDATGTPDPSESSNTWDFGTIPTNQPADNPAVANIYLNNNGGDVLGVTGVTLTDDGDGAFTLYGNSCQWAYLTREGSQSSCIVSVKAQPTTVSDTPVTGTLTIDTTGGDPLTVALTVVGGEPVPAPGPPTDVEGSVWDHHVNLSWTAPADVGGVGQSIQQYDVRYSATGGAPWTDGPTTSNTATTIGSLTDGTAYVFEVAADNGYEVSDYSAPSAGLTPHAHEDPSGLSAIAAKTVSFGKPVTLSTTLTDTTTHAPIAGVMVALKAGNVTGVGVKTNSKGVATETIHPTTNARYLWVFGGSSGHAAVSSAGAVVSVAQVVHAALSPSHVKAHKQAKIYGTVSPSETGKSVTLQELVNGKWKTLSTATIKRQNLPTGKKAVGFVLSVKPSKKGTETLRVSRPATSVNAAGVSQRLKLKVT
jgi:hypothetical protein